MKHSVIVDGPNLISRIIDLNIDKDKLAKSFSLNRLLQRKIFDEINDEFERNTINQGIEFICSNKLLGPKGNKLSNEQNQSLLERLSYESAVYINQISISSTNEEKGVDIAVATRLIEVSETCDIICLIASDKDYIPVLEYLKRKGKYIVTIGIKEKHPIELINLSYLFIDITDYLKENY